MIIALIVVSVLLFLSVVANIVFVLYSRSILSRLMVASEHAVNIFTELFRFSKHLEELYALPVYHGEGRIKSLLEHTSHMIGFCKQYYGIYSFTDPQLEEMLIQEVLDEQEEDFAAEDRNEVEEAPQESTQKSLFYGGTRRSNHRV